MESFLFLHFVFYGYKYGLRHSLSLTVCLSVYDDRNKPSGPFVAETGAVA